MRMRHVLDLNHNEPVTAGLIAALISTVTTLKKLNSVA
jgi:hypothetical protein